jgi:hypothetical protein
MLASNCLDREHVGYRASEWNSVTGKWDNIYIAAIAGIESYPDQLYAITCEAHGEHTSARSLTTPGSSRPTPPLGVNTVKRCLRFKHRQSAGCPATPRWRNRTRVAIEVCRWASV